MPTASETKLLGIQLELNSAGVVTGASLANDALESVRSKATQTQESVTDATTQMAAGVADVSAGAKEIGGRLTKAGDKVLGFFKGTVGMAGNAEESLGKVQFSMGLIGDKANDPKLKAAFERIKAQLIDIGKTAGITTAEAAEGFFKIRSAGLNAMDSVKVLKYAQAMVAASQGQMKMAQASQVASLIMNKFNLNAEETGLAMDGLVQASTRLNLPFKDMQIMLMSLGAVSTKFSSTSLQQFMSLAGVLRTMGMRAMRTTSLIQGFGNSVTKVLETLDSKTRSGRAQRKVFAQYGFSREMFVDAQGKYLALTQIIANVEKQLGGLDKVQRAAALKATFGNNRIGMMLDLVKAGAAKQGKTVEEMALDMRKAGGISLAAQKDYLKSWKGVMQVWKGSQNELKAAIGTSLLPLLKPIMDWLIVMVKAFGAWAKENPRLAKGIMIVVIALALLAKLAGVAITLLGAMAAVVTIMGPAMASGAVGTGVLTGSFWALAASVWAALWPLLLVIGSILISLAIMYGAYLVIKNFGTIWVWVKEVFWEAVDGIVTGAKWLWAGIIWPFVNIRKVIAFFVSSSIAMLRMFVWYILFGFITAPIRAAKFLINNWRAIVAGAWWMVRAIGIAIVWFAKQWWDGVMNIWTGIKWLFTVLPVLIIESSWYMFKQVMGFIKQILLGIKDGLGQGWQDVIDWIIGTATRIYDSAVDIGSKLISGIKQGIVAAWEGFKKFMLGKVKWIRDLWPFSPAKAGPLMTLHKGGEGIVNEVTKGIGNKEGEFNAAVTHMIQGGVQNTPLAPGGGGGGFTGNETFFGTGAKLFDEQFTDVDLGSTIAAAQRGGGGEQRSSGGINITISKMQFYAGKLSANEAEAFTGQVMKKIASKLRDFKDRKGSAVS